MKKYNSTKIHKLLCKNWLSDFYKNRAEDVFIEKQALDCPYYVPLKGRLGMDWGVIVNPSSARFGKPTFEHDFCGCSDGHGEGDQENPDEWMPEEN